MVVQASRLRLLQRGGKRRDLRLHRVNVVVGRPLVALTLTVFRPWCCASLSIDIADSYVVELFLVACASVVLAIARCFRSSFVSLFAFDVVVASICFSFHRSVFSFYLSGHIAFLRFTLVLPVWVALLLIATRYCRLSVGCSSYEGALLGRLFWLVVCALLPG